MKSKLKKRGCTPTSSSGAVPTKQSKLAWIPVICICQKGEDKKAGHVVASLFTLFPLQFGLECVYNQPRWSLWFLQGWAQVESQELPDESQWSSEAAQTTQSSPKSKFRSLSARRRHGTDTRVCTPTPILPLPRLLLSSLSDSGAVRAVLGQARPGPTRGGRLRGRPSRGKGAERGTAGGEPAASGYVLGNRGIGWVGAGAAPVPQARASP